MRREEEREEKRRKIGREGEREGGRESGRGGEKEREEGESTTRRRQVRDGLCEVRSVLIQRRQNSCHP